MKLWFDSKENQFKNIVKDFTKIVTMINEQNKTKYRWNIKSVKILIKE